MKKSGSYDLTVQFKKSVMNSPADIPKNSVKPSMDVKVGGADKGSVKVEGPTNDKPIKSGDPIEIPDLKGTYKPGATGGSSGGLAATGASDHGTLTALGLLAGTAILLGGAVFAFTPRRYLRR